MDNIIFKKEFNLLERNHVEEKIIAGLERYEKENDHKAELILIDIYSLIQLETNCKKIGYTIHGTTYKGVPLQAIETEHEFIHVQRKNMQDVKKAMDKKISERKTETQKLMDAMSKHMLNID